MTEAGTLVTGAVKSSIGIGALLGEGIGDTMRVSLTTDPVEEVRVGFEILKALGLRQFGPTADRLPVVRPDQRRGARAGRAVEGG